MTSILLVEDHAIFAKTLLRMLQERGHLNVVEIAQSAEEALDNGIANLTKEATTMMVHFGPGRSQQWNLIRVEQPAETKGPK